LVLYAYLCVFAHSRFVENPPIWSWETKPLIFEVVLSQWSMMHSQLRTRLCSRRSHSKRLALIVLCHRPRSAPTWRRRSCSAYGSISLRWILFFILARCYGVVHKFLHVKKTNFNSSLKWLVFSFIKKCLCAYKIDQKSIFLYHQSHFLTWLDVTVLCISF
jgi:hypothetical protein